MACSIARTWSVIGEPWTPLILRDLTIGLRRFDDLKTDLGIATNVLAARLRLLEDEGVIERRPYTDTGRTRDEYHLTHAGEGLVPVLVMITSWGDHWLTETGPPTVFEHETCGGKPVTGVVTCSHCCEELTAENTKARPGPGAARGPGTELIARQPPDDRAPTGTHSPRPRNDSASGGKRSRSGPKSGYQRS